MISILSILTPFSFSDVASLSWAHPSCLCAFPTTSLASHLVVESYHITVYLFYQTAELNAHSWLACSLNRSLLISLSCFISLSFCPSPVFFSHQMFIKYIKVSTLLKQFKYNLMHVNYIQEKRPHIQTVYTKSCFIWGIMGLWIMEWVWAYKFS